MGFEAFTKSSRHARYGVRSIYKEQSRQGRAAMTDQKDKTGCQIWGSKHLQIKSSHAREGQPCLTKRTIVLAKRDARYGVRSIYK